MKQTSLIFNVVLSIAVVVLFILHFNSGKTSNNTGSSNTSTEVADVPSGSIVYIQIDSLINQYDMFNDLRSELQVKFEAVQDDLQKKGRSFERDAKDFEEKLNKGLITRSQAEQMQQTLVSRQQELQNYSQQKQMEMSEEEAVLYNRVMDAINTFLTEYNKEKNYSMILTTSGTTNVVIKGAASLDITWDVLKGLNDEYVSKKSKK